jgi:NodT family efflux transporter outer membrane factor (OMF) lipoprotein
MNIIRISKIGVAAAAVLMLGSCNIYKKYETPQSSTLTRAYAEARQESVDSAAFGNLLWEDVFTDPILVDLINQALENNTNLRNAKLNVDIAHAQLKGAKLAYLPSLTLAPNGAGSSYDGSALSWTYTLPLQASWEVDIFGKLLNSKRGAQAAVYQSEAYAQAVRSQIIAGVANTYYALVATRSQLELSRSTAGLWAETVQTMKDLKLSGGITEAGVVQSAAAYYSILASITDLEAAVDKLNNTMSLLVNVMPQEWNVPSTINMQLPNILREGVPMRELACRPDVAAAEQSLATAYYATNSARAAFYPGLTISATGGFTNILGSFIQNPGVWFYNLAGSLTAPLFSRGQNIARLEAAKAQQEQALNNFEYTLLSAAAEVKDALTVYDKSVEKSGYLVDQVDQLTKSVDYTKELLLYSTGSVNYLEVLTAQQNLLSAQISQISCQLSQAQAIINLYQSLGGGR